MTWTERYDRIYCCHYLPQTEKLPRLKEELKRVGIEDSGILEMRYTIPTRYDEEIWEKYKDRQLAPTVAYVNICQEIRKVLCEAMYFGYKRILLLENDVAFLKDIGEIERLLDTAAKDYDIVQYDKFVLDNGWMKQEWEKRLVEKRINDDYIDASGTLFTSAACMELSAKGIEEMLKLMSVKICATDVAPLLMKGCKYAVAVKNMAVQVFYRNSSSTDMVGIEYMHQAYRNSGVDYGLYNVPEGYGFGSAILGCCIGNR